MIQPLRGLKVIDLSRLIAGPYCAQLLADLGAEVIKVEPLDGDDARHLGPPFVDGAGIFFLATNGGKRSIALDLRNPQGREIVLRLAESADIFVENFRPGMVEKLGVSVEDIRQRNPSIIYCSISGFGAHGPMRDRGGVDTIFQATGGLIATIKSPDGEPIKVASPIADVAAAQSAAFAITAAVLNRIQTGNGAHINVAIRDALAALLTPVLTYAAITRTNPPNWGNASPFAAPADIFKTKDGHVAISIINDKHWRLLREVLELPRDDRFDLAPGRIENRAALSKQVQSVLLKFQTSHWEAQLSARGVPVGRILPLTEIACDEQMIANGLFVETPEGRAVGLPFQFDNRALRSRGGIPACGQDTSQILKDLEYSDSDIDALVADTVVYISSKSRKAEKTNELSVPST
jgi:crotonobetainyl-CoA:carnitine CoA-transferase CaiB-like acyl-CoA transferase